MRKGGGSHPPSVPPVLGEPGAPVHSPLKPRPYLRSGAVALPEPDLDEFSVIMPRRAARNLP